MLIAICSRSAGVPVIDTYIPLEKLYREDGYDAVGALYINHQNLHLNAHMSAAGNEFVANYIAQQLGSLF